MVETDYDISLIKNNNKWLLETIKSNDYFDQTYEKNNFNYDEMLKEMTATPQQSTANIAKTNLATASIISYNRSAAVSYADTYWSNYNTSFPNFNSSGGDCQNFASQCVSSGFSSRMQYSGSAPWYCSSSTSYSSSWLSCTPFSDMVRISDSSTPGLLGYVPTNNLICYAQPGDVIQGSGSGGAYQHAVVVVQVTNSDGNQTPSSIYVDAHNNNRYHVTLSWMFGNGLARHQGISGWVY